eukprot:CAMPEP_0184267998 /NCGR_PEP_ID=MMETSP0977-20130417/31302_1 /TAXON_ID=483370 /ORGANISM="non described non described, Strain CCMP2097" /LENGTH=79 /DNA_ID=CAMNT_0026573795 /DNA_START=74 /DNA_END=309 /DNA_ORIENTATION=-
MPERDPSRTLEGASRPLQKPHRTPEKMDQRGLRARLRPVYGPRPGRDRRNPPPSSVETHRPRPSKTTAIERPKPPMDCR